MTLLLALQRFCSQYGYDKTYWIGYSGGLDSHVLLAVCHALRLNQPIKLRAIHINHGLNAKSKIWADHCARVCEAYEIDYLERSIQFEQTAGRSLEELAREKRYAIFAECLNDGDLLMTAHQQDDQAETLLLQLFRGAGPKGLAAMPVERSFARGFHLRPFLGFTRSMLQEYAELMKLKWIEDESNQNLHLTRNFIRHDVLPRLKARWPTVTIAISRTASHCAEAQALLEEVALDVGKKVSGSKINTLSVNKLLQLTAENQKLVLRTWIRALDYPLPDAKKIQTILNNALKAASDKMPCIRWGGIELRRFRDDLYLMPCLPIHNAQQIFEWDLETKLKLPGIGVLSAIRSEVKTETQRKHYLCLDIRSVSVRFRRGGEIARLPKRGHHTLKNLFQEWGVPPWERDRIPLIFVNEKLISAVGYFIDPEYMAEEDKKGYILMLEEHPPSS